MHHNINILALETSTPVCSVALRAGEHTYAVDENQPFNHTETILKQVEQVLESAGITLQSLHAIAFGRGPGSFTGLRIAAAVTQGLALGRNPPVIPISTLQILAQDTYQSHGAMQVIAALDARMGEIYWGCYECENGIMQLRGEEQVSKPNNLILPEMFAPNWQGAGSGWREYGPKILNALPAASVNKMYPDAWPRAAAMLDIAVKMYEEKQTVSADKAIPIYLRDNVVS